MASNARGPNTTTTTTTSTTITITRSRSPRDPSTSPNLSSSAGNRTHRYTISNDHLIPPPAHGINNNGSTEPFPSLSPNPSRSPELAQVQTMDHYPGSNPVSRTSTRQPATTVSTQIRRRPIGIKRLSSQNLTPQITYPSVALSTSGRRRSTSAPQRPVLVEDGGPLQHSFTAASDLPALVEGQESAPFTRTNGQDYEMQEANGTSGGITRSRGGSQRLRRMSDAARSAVSRMSNRSDDAQGPADEYDDKIVDVLDVLDPEVSTLTTLTNVQNSLFVPDLGRWLNRRPTYELTKGPSYRSQRPTLNRGTSKPLPPTPLSGPPPLTENEVNIPSDIEEESISPVKDRRLSLASIPSITSNIQEEHYAVLPHGVSLEGWTEEEKELLDDHVRHMLHSKREGFKRSMRAFGKYIRKPLGFFVTLYAVLITLFGLAWVLFLIGWIYVGDKQLYVINVIDNVLVALFAIVGDGMAPFRAVDTYHMSFIAYYHHLTEKTRKKRALPKLQDHNELPDVHESEVDVEAAVEKGEEFSVLTEEQQKKLEHHQAKFSKSHSFYKPHETTTHHAFPHHLFVAIVILLDMHSCLQITLGGTTWGTNYLTRPKALTPTILSCSITVNILAGVLIKVGDNKTRKKDVLERMFRQELTEEAMRRVDKQKEGERTHSRDDDEAHLRREKDVSEDHVQEESKANRFSNSTVKFSPELPSKSY